MTLQQFKTEFRLTDFRHDAWGCVMEACFECAGRMYWRRLPIPSEWEYKPGLHSDGIDKENYWHSHFA